MEEKAQHSNQTDEALTIAELLDEEGDLSDRASVMEKRVQQYKTLKYIRVVILFLIWLSFTTILLITHDSKMKWCGTVVPIAEEGKQYNIAQQPEDDKLTLQLKAPFQEKLTDIVEGKFKGNHLSHLHMLAIESEYKLLVSVERTFNNQQGELITETVSEILSYPLVKPEYFDMRSTIHIERLHIFTLKSTSGGGNYSYRFKLRNVDKPFPLQLQSHPTAIKTPVSIALSALLICGMYVLFFWDVVTRGITAMLFSTLTVALLGLYQYRPPLEELIQYVDLDTILLVFGLTLIICVFAETGGDHYLAVQAYRLSNGHIWPMLTIMCLVVTFGAAFLDNTTILILVTSLAIRLCEIMQLNATSVLTCLILFSNNGYMLTKSGLPEQAVLSQRGVIDHEYIYRNYGNYMLQMLVPVVISMALTYAYLRLYYGSSERMRIIEPPIVSRLRNAIRLWQRTAQGVSGYTKEEAAVRQNLLFRVDRLRKRFRRLGKMPLPAKNFQENLRRLQDQHPIRDRVLLIMCCVVLLAVVIMQIANAFHAHQLKPGWICLLFALVLLALANWQEFDALMVKIDWSTLITIACLYIISRSLKPLGLVESIGDNTMHMVSQISRRHRLNTAVIVLLCVTTFGSAFMDSAYVCYVMASKAMDMSHDPNFNLALEPMLLAVLLGTGFGHNATLVSGISNIVCAGIAEKHGFKFYFWDFFKVGFVVTIGNIIMGMIYLLIFNTIFGYN